MKLRRLITGATLAAILGCNCAVSSRAQTNDFSGRTDESILAVLELVADRQLRVSATNPAPIILADGAYPVARALAEATNATRPTGIAWNYPWGVTLYGLLQAYRATGNTNYLNFVLKHNQIVGRYYYWLRSLHNSLTNTTGLASFQQSTAIGEFFKNDSPATGKLDYCGAMGAQFMECILNHAGNVSTEQLHVGLNVARYISSVQSRLPDGTLWRTNTSPQRTIWADDLYMSCPFLIRWYLYTGQTNCLDDAARQIMNMASYLQDTDGLWYHGYFVDSKAVNGFKWGRANGWAMVATVEVLSVMPVNHPARSNLLSILRRHIEGVKSVQASSGMWRQVLDYPQLWEETSCTAMFTYSIARAVNRGWIDPTNIDVARRGFVGVAANIDTNGAVLNVSQGTGIGTSLSFYQNRQRPYDDSHGRGAVLLAASELLLSPRLAIATTDTGAAVSWHGGLRDWILETSTNLDNWDVSATQPVVTESWLNVATEPFGDACFYRLRFSQPCYPPAPISFEAELLPWTTNGAAAVLSSPDTNASGGLFVTFYADGPGDYIEFTLTNVPAGAYRLKTGFKSNTNRGQVIVTVDGTQLDTGLDEYFYQTLYPTMDFGLVTFDESCDHSLRFTVTGKHGASTGYTFVADKFILCPQ